MPTRQHYVPRFYLEGFADPQVNTSSSRVEPYVWIADLAEGKMRKRSPANAAQLPGYYDLDSDVLGDRSIVETLLSGVESKASAVIRKLRNGDYQLSDDERFRLATHIGLQLGRVPVTRSAVEIGLTKRAQDLLRLGVKENAFKTKSSTATHWRGFGDHLEISPRRDFLIASALKLGLMMAELVFSMNWLLVRADPGASFFTSDNPVGLLSPNGKPMKIRPEQLDPRLEISFPISFSCALLVHQRFDVPVFDIVSANVETVMEMNRRILPTVQRYVFCSGREQCEWVLSTKLNNERVLP